MCNPRYRKLVAIAWKQWSLEQCAMIYNMGPAKYEQDGKPKQSSMGVNVAIYVAKKKYNTDLKPINK